MSENGKPRSRARIMFDALEQLSDEPEVIVIRRQPTNGRGTRGHWVISTTGHNTHHTHIDHDADLMLKILMQKQERDLP